MARATGYTTRVFIEGNEVTQRVAAIDLKVRPGAGITAVVELFDATVDKDPETGALTFYIGQPSEKA
jgi:hypothetical protein